MPETETDRQARAVAQDAAKNWALRYPIPAWGLAEGERADRLAENWARVVAGAVLDALRAAGCLLPEGGETDVEWGVRVHGQNHGIGEGALSEQQARREVAEGRGVLVQRETRYWPDGSWRTGPWVVVDQEATDA